MGKRKTKVNTLTKIDPSLLRPQTISQHATEDGTRVTTSVKPSQPPVVQDPLQNPAIFDAGVLNYDSEHLEDGGDDVSRGYYVSKVRVFLPSYLTYKTHYC